MEIHLWTDGSSINNGEYKGVGGYGYVLLFGDFKDSYQDKHYDTWVEHRVDGGESSDETTNQREEMKAVIFGLKRIKLPCVHKIKIFSDSAYTINCFKHGWWKGWLANGWKNSKKEPVANKDLWIELLSLVNDEMLDIEFVKVKGHSGIKYNEECDVIAGNHMNEAKQRRLKQLEEK